MSYSDYFCTRPRSGIVLARNLELDEGPAGIRESVVRPSLTGGHLAPLLTPRSEMNPAAYASVQVVQPLRRMAK